MAVLPVGFGQATVVISNPGPGSPAMVTFGFEDVPASGADTLANAIYDAWADPLAFPDAMDADSIIREVRVLIRRAAGLVAGVHIEDTPGTIAGPGNAPQVACIVQKLTGFAGRNRRGRMYLPGITGATESGIIGALRFGEIQASTAAFFADLSANITNMVLLHTDPADPPTVITDLVPQSLVGTQRRRVR